MRVAVVLYGFIHVEDEQEFLELKEEIENSAVILQYDNKEIEIEFPEIENRKYE